MNRPAVTARVLFVAERGGAHDDVALLIGVAEQVEALGFAPVFALADGVTPAALFEGRAWPRLPAPAHPAPLQTRTGPTSYGDMLAVAGFADAEDLGALARQYDALFDLVEPAFIIGAHAPAAALAARGRLPVGLVGTGFTLPPHHTALFPALRPDTASVRPQDMVLGSVNAVLRQRGAAALDTLPQLLATEARAVLTVRALDPYAPVRTEPYAALANTPVAMAPETDGVFACLDADRGEAADAVEALAQLAGDIPVAVHLHGAGARASAAYLARRGATVHAQPADMDAAMRTAKVALTHGGHGAALSALQCGRFQLVAPSSLEGMLNGLALERLGAGAVAWKGGEISGHLASLLTRPIDSLMALAHDMERPARFDAAAFVATLQPQRRGKPSAAKPSRGQRSQAPAGGASVSNDSQPSAKPAA